MHTKRTVFIAMLSGVFLTLTSVSAQAQYAEQPSYLLSRLVQEFVRPGGDASSLYSTNPYRYNDRYRTPRDFYRDDSYRATHRHYKYERRQAKLEHKYNKAMRRLDRQERNALDHAYRKYHGDTSHTGYRERVAKIDRKFDHKRFKVERNIGKDYRKRVRRHGHGDSRPACGITYNRSAY